MRYRMARPKVLSFLALLGSCSLALGYSHSDKLARGTFRTNTTAHYIFNTVSSLLQHWPNTLYRNGHTFVPAIIPSGTLLHHARRDYNPPPSPEYFAFDFDHSYIFCLGDPCVVFTYAVNRDLRVGYFDGTGAAEMYGPRDMQDIVFNDGFVPPKDYNPWRHAESMCVWARKVGLDGIVRMEPSFEAILCNIESDLHLVSDLELVFPHSPLKPPAPHHNLSDAAKDQQTAWPHPRADGHGPIFPGPTVPMTPPPPGWTGKQRAIPDTVFECLRAGMWHNHSPGEGRVRLDYSGIVSAYSEEYTSLVKSRRGLPRTKHRLGGISAEDRKRLQAEAHEVLTRGSSLAKMNWSALFQGVIDRYADRLEELRYILRRPDIHPTQIVATVRHKVLIMLTPYMVLPQAKKSARSSSVPNEQVVLKQPGPDDDWFSRIHRACASYATAGITQRDSLTKQEKMLAGSIDDVQGEICLTLTAIWSTAFDSQDKPVFAKHLVSEWRTEVEELMGWLDWHMWAKCDPPCGPGLTCALTTWPWEVWTGDEEVVPTCRNHVSSVEPDVLG
ncbi:hypothetical protein BDV93DRAFT_462584 [Ceratobasidium sp. AG-I]|nr:hypothetical protein BDV93DRAFT_462584 [Ceratobasidium sp. AG-I]